MAAAVVVRAAAVVVRAAAAAVVVRAAAAAVVVVRAAAAAGARSLPFPEELKCRKQSLKNVDFTKTLKIQNRKASLKHFKKSTIFKVN